MEEKWEWDADVPLLWQLHAYNTEVLSSSSSPVKIPFTNRTWKQAMVIGSLSAVCLCVLHCGVCTCVHGIEGEEDMWVSVNIGEKTMHSCACEWMNVQAVWSCILSVLPQYIHTTQYCSSSSSSRERCTGTLHCISVEALSYWDHIPTVTDRCGALAVICTRLQLSFSRCGIPDCHPSLRHCHCHKLFCRCQPFKINSCPNSDALMPPQFWPIREWHLFGGGGGLIVLKLMGHDQGWEEKWWWWELYVSS